MKKGRKLGSKGWAEEKEEEEGSRESGGYFTEKMRLQERESYHLLDEAVYFLLVPTLFTSHLCASKHFSPYFDRINSGSNGGISDTNDGNNHKSSNNKGNISV